MTQKEIRLIDTINREGLDNFMCGIETCNHSNDTRYMYGTEQHRNIPPHIYIYRRKNDKPIICVEVVAPDALIVNKNGLVIDLYFIEMEGGEQ